MRKILKQEFAIWWLVFASIIVAKYSLLGNSNDSLFDTSAYESYGIVFKVVSIILWSSVFGTLFNWIYKLISSNYNPKVHLSIIGVIILILLFILDIYI